MNREEMQTELDALKARIAELESQMNEPEWVPFPGELAEVSDDQESWQTRPILEHNPDAEYPYISDAVNWRYARPLSDPNVIQLRPHTPGDPMPCGENARVIYRSTIGGFSWSLARDLDWGSFSDMPGAAIVAWAPLP